jgi:hypothetical protein
MTQPIHDEQAGRREVFAAVNAGLDAGLPAPRVVSFDNAAWPSVVFDNVGDLGRWAAWFGYAMTVPAERTDLYRPWRGGVLHLGAKAPVACSPECAARPEEWPCLDSCPAQVAARNS